MPFRGELFVDAVSGEVTRATWQAVNIPEGFPARQTGTAVEYRAVDIGGKSYICPVKSITLSDSLVYAADSSHAFPVHSINEARFTHYRKFDIEATFIAGQAPGESGRMVEEHEPAFRGSASPTWLFMPVPLPPPFPEAAR